MISQSSSEASICLAVPQADAEQAERALKRAFRAWMSRGEVEEIAVRGGVGLIAAVGLGMAQTPGVSARLFAALARRKINVLAIAQGSSELNISLAVEQAQVAEAVRAVHHEFGLHLMDAGEDGGRRMDLILLGFGKVGQAVARLIEARKDEIARRVGLEPRVVAVGDRSGFLLEPRGLSGEALEEAARQKNAGQPLVRQEGGKLGSFGVLVRAALSYRLSRPVVVELSDAEGSEEVFEQALSRGADVVTANKKPLAGPRAGFEALWRAMQASGRLLKAEATVGAGLPVVDTLDMLLATGDRLTGAQGCFSGTLGFVTARLEEGAKLSEAVSEAKERGYTEPDPAEDLAGMDVARKALILGRLSGIAPDEGCVSLTGLVPQEWIGRPWPALLAHLQGRDEALAAEVREAKERGLRWRFVATVEPGKIVVGPTLVPADSALGGLKGTDNMIVFRSDRYEARPLVISGPGAGIEVTAMAVLGDILRVAAQRS
jgi:aspartokinase/homoserine dehydrogenase 1